MNSSKIADELKRFDEMLDEAEFKRMMEAVRRLAEPVGSTSTAPANETADSFGNYRLVEKIGQGGMGTVWKAEQVHPIQRVLAIKVVRSPFESDEVLARFQVERQALAMMDHENIARIVDAGTTDQGQPFFAMEFIDGQNLCRFCDANQLGIEARLRLFSEICSAVQHAHQTGIIHRDLKPDNILVKLIDGKPVPTIIDFGIAKAVSASQKQHWNSNQTVAGQLVGSLKYMSPEQTRMKPGIIDTRSDIYSLGIILYELVCGKTPLGDEAITDQALIDVLENIQQVEPLRPSLRLAGAREHQSDICRRRKSDASVLQRQLAGDLDWIVMKAIEKDPARRYQSASELRADIARFLTSEPVLARPASFVYRFKKLLRRHRLAFAATGLILTTLLAGLIGTSLGWSRAFDAERLALERLAETENARQAETAARRAETLRAEGERLAKEKAEQLVTQTGEYNEILRSLFRDFNPRQREKHSEPLERRMASRLFEAGRKIGQNQYAGVRYQVKLLLEIGQTVMDLGYPDDAIELFKLAESIIRDNAADTEETWVSLTTSSIGKAYLASGKPDLAIPLFQRVWDHYRVVKGEFAYSTLSAMHCLSVAEMQTGAYDDAIDRLELIVPKRVKLLGPTNRATLTSMSVLATTYWWNGQMTQAEQLLRQVYSLRKENLGEESVDAIVSLSNLASLLTDMGDDRKAAELQTKALELIEKKLGPNHSDTLAVTTKAAHSYLNLGEYERARQILDRVIPKLMQEPGEQHPRTIAAQSERAVLHLADNQYELAVSMLINCHELAVAEQGESHPDTISHGVRLARALGHSGEIDKAIDLCRELIARSKEKLGLRHLSTQSAILQLGSLLIADGRPESAVTKLEQLFDPAQVAEKRKVFRQGLTELAIAWRLVGRQADSRELLERLLENWQPVLGELHPETKRMMAELVLVGPEG